MVVPGGKGSLRAFSPESLAGVCCLTRGSMLRRLPGPFGVWACGTENTVQAARVRPVACQCRGGEGSVTLVAEGRGESRKQKAEGRRQKAEGRGQRAEGRRQKSATPRSVCSGSPRLISAFLSAFCFLSQRNRTVRD